MSGFVSVALQSAALSVGQVPDPKAPPALPPPVTPDPVKNDPKLAASVEKVAAFGKKGMSLYNLDVTGGKDGRETPFDPEKLPPGVNGTRYASAAPYFFRAFDELNKAIANTVPPPGTMPLRSGDTPLNGSRATVARYQTASDQPGWKTFGDLGTKPEDVARLRDAWVNERLAAFDSAAKGASMQMTDMAGRIDRIDKDGWGVMVRDANGKEARNDRNQKMRVAVAPVVREFDATVLPERMVPDKANPSKMVKAPEGETRAMLRAHLEKHYDAERARWIVGETDRQRVAVTGGTLEQVGIPVMRAPDKPSIPMATLPDGTRVFEQAGVKVHLRQDAKSGDWAWGQPGPDGTVPANGWRSSRQQYIAARTATTADASAALALNQELAYLSRQEPTHYVIKTDTQTLHARYFRDAKSPNGGEWKWGATGPDGSVPPTGWKSMTDVAGLPKDIQENFARVNTRQQLAPELLAAEMPKVANETAQILTAARATAIDRFLKGETGAAIGFRPVDKIDLGNGTITSGYQITEGGFEAQVFRADPANPNSPLLFRARQRFDAQDPEKKDTYNARTTAWSQPSRLPTGDLEALPSGTEPGNGKNPVVEGRIAVHNKLRLLRGIEANTEISDAKAAAGTVDGYVRSAMTRGTSYDPAENMLRLVFGATDAPEQYGPGVLKVNAAGKSLLVRRLAASERTSRFNSTAEGFGQWEFATEPTAPKPGEAAPAPEWKTIFTNQKSGDPAGLGAFGQILDRFRHTEPWTSPRIHPMVWADYSGQGIGSKERVKTQKDFAEGFLATVGAKKDRDEWTVALPGTNLAPPMKARLTGNGWEVNLTGKADDWRVAGDSNSFYTGTNAQHQRANQVITILGEFNRGVNFDPTKEVGLSALKLANSTNAPGTDVWTIEAGGVGVTTKPQARYAAGKWEVSLNGTTWVKAGDAGSLLPGSNLFEQNCNRVIGSLALAMDPNWKPPGAAVLPPPPK